MLQLACKGNGRGEGEVCPRWEGGGEGLHRWGGGLSYGKEGSRGHSPTPHTTPE